VLRYLRRKERGGVSAFFYLWPDIRGSGIYLFRVGISSFNIAMVIAVRRVRASRNQRWNRRKWALCALLATASLASARSDDGPTVKVSTTSSASISLDGLLNEPAWRDAPVLKLVQQAPKPGQPTPYETQVQVIVTGDRLYLGFTCKDPDPRRIAIHTMRRDGE